MGGWWSVLRLHESILFPAVTKKSRFAHPSRVLAQTYNYISFAPMPFQPIWHVTLRGLDVICANPGPPQSPADNALICRLAANRRSASEEVRGLWNYFASTMRGNLRQSCYFSLNLLLHYLVKHECSKQVCFVCDEP